METKRKQTALFFLLTFVWTWVCYFAIVGLGLSPYQGMGMIFLILGGCSPTFVGLILAMATYPKAQRIDFLKRVVQARRIGAKWWLFILLFFVWVAPLAVGLDMAAGGSVPGMANLKAIASSPVMLLPLLLLSFMSGPFSEELGWRGFALEPMLRTLGFTKGCAALGLIWGAWHLPLYFMPETWHGKTGLGFSGFGMFLLFSVGLSFIMGRVYLNTGRSILSAMLMHLASNFPAQLLEPVSRNADVLREAIVLVIGVAVAIHVIRTGRDAPGYYQTLG